MSILDIKDLEIQFQTDDGCAKAVNGVNLSLEEGDTLGLVGETGAGKTTTALGIMRLISDRPESMWAVRSCSAGKICWKSRKRKCGRSGVSRSQ